MGNSGNVILFIFGYAALVIMGTALFAYASRCFLVALEGTATGNDEVSWPDEPFQDWLWRGVTLAWLLLIWLAPLGGFLKVAWPGIWREEPMLALTAMGGMLWIFFPLGVLSALSSTSRMVFFRWKVVAGLARKGSATLQFYAGSLGVIVIGLGAWGMAFRAQPKWLPVAAVVGSAALLVYARMLGRLGWVLSAPKGRKKKRRGPVEASALVPPPPPVGTQSVVAVATGEEEDIDDVGGNEPPPASTSVAERQRPRRVDGYDVADEAEEETPAEQAEELLQPLRRRVERAQGRLHATAPLRSMWRGVWSFPFYDATRTAWVKLSLISLVVGYLLYTLVANPL